MSKKQFLRAALAIKRFNKKNNRKHKIYLGKQQKEKNRQNRIAKNLNRLRKEIGGEITFQNIVKRYLPNNTAYLLNCANCKFSWDELSKITPWNKGIFKVPEKFSLIDNADESFQFLQQVLIALLKGKRKSLFFDYQFCKRLDIAAQVFLDIIIKDVISLYDICDRKLVLKAKLGVSKAVGLTNIQSTNESILKILYSVGSPAIHSKRKIISKDIIPYELCIHNRGEDNSEHLAIQRDAIDTTTLVDYVRESLQRVKKDLSPEDLENLSNIISEILINAEEHSTVGSRFSIGYFQEDKKDGKHSGIFRLVIMNFGKTIYEKFADPDCENQRIVKVMKNLSSDYTKKKFFFLKEFEEETLWTLYALQEGVTSVSPEKYPLRGNGSIQFIKSFFNLRGEDKSNEYKSRMTILSGNTSITFDGTYKIIDKINENGKFSYMTFNESGNINDKPDKNFVKYVENYFPGTVISARIWLDEEDITNDQNK
jgi:hypothetical protein